jgi:hypothetical protein
MNEFVALAAAIEAGNAPLPPFIGKLIQNAPESFDDGRAAQIAVTVAAMRHASEPVNFPAIGEKHLPILNFVSELANSALPMESAEYEAEKCWQGYQVRRGKTIGDELIQSLNSSPNHAQTIMATACAALESVSHDRKENGFTIRTPDEVLEMTFNDDDIIVGDRIIAEGQSCVIAAAGGSGKSRLVMQIPACVTTGRKFLNFQTGQNDSDWLFLQTENSNRRLKDDFARLKSWLGEDWPKFAAHVKFHTVENDTDSFVNLDSPDAVINIESAIKQHKPDVIVIDPLNDFAIGDLNKDADMKVTLQALSRICRKGNPKRAIVVLHHALTGKAGALKATGFDRSSFGRNSKTLHAWTRAQINLAPVDPDSNDRLIVGCGKCSNGREFPTYAVRLNTETMIYECDPTVDVMAWQTEMTGKSEAMELSPDMVAGIVAELSKAGGAPKKPQIVKAIRADTGCASSGAYKAIERAERAKKIHYTKATKTYVTK